MTRMHPQDLRAIMAASFAATMEPGKAWINPSINCADALLAELERTAKPEAEMLDAHHCACGRSIHRLPEPTRTCSELDETAPVPPCPACGGKGWFQVDQGHHWPCDCAAGKDTARSPQTLAQAKAQGAREERERIIAGQVSLGLEWLDEALRILATHPHPAGVSCALEFNLRNLRAALEPKP